jgi:hypothetical protein
MRRVGRPLLASAPSIVAVTLLAARPLAAQERTAPAQDPSGADTPDRFTVLGQSETYVQLYRQALVPGQSGAQVPTETAVPVHEYLFASARDVDAPWQKDAIGVEFAAWGRLWPTESSMQRPFDGDIQTANVRVDAGPGWARLGRQQMAGGAARFARFDGLTLGVSHLGFFAEGYGGFTVLPRWNSTAYHSLGKEEDTWLTVPPLKLERSSHWLAGGRAGYKADRVSGSVSLHEQRTDGGVDHRNLGLDLGGRPIDEASLGASALLDLDSGRFATARFWVDASPHRLIDLGAEYLHAEPSLLLSRQSVLSVFTTNGYEEVGGTVQARLESFLRLEAAGYIEAYEDNGSGERGELAARFAWGRSRPTLIRLAFMRVIAPENGYRATRVSFSQKLTSRLGGTLEAYGYFYDQPVAGFMTSSVYAGTATYQILDRLDALLSGSLARSPYAAFDAQTMLRVTYSFDASSRRRFQ